MSQLLITLPSPGASTGNDASIKLPDVAYAVVSSAGLLTSHGHVAPALLPKADTATLIVPAQALSWHLAGLPKLPRGSSAQKQQAVLAGVLEEQLLDDVASLHLVAFPSLVQDGKTWVAACKKSWLLDAIKFLQAANVPLSSIVPQVFPNQLASLHASGSPESAWFTFSDAQGVITLPVSQAAMALKPWPEDLMPSAEPAVAALAEQAFGLRIDVLQASQWAMQAVVAAKAQGVELAQGDLAVSGGGRAWQALMSGLRGLWAAPAWRPVRYGLVLLLMANVLGLNAWAWKQSSAVAQKRGQLNQVLTTTFPNVKVVVDAPLQMQRELVNLRQTQGQLSGRDFESIYSRFSGIALINSEPNAIYFIANEVQISGVNFSGEQLNAMLPRLQYAGLAVRSDARALMVSHSDAAVVQTAAQAKPTEAVKP